MSNIIDFIRKNEFLIYGRENEDTFRDAIGLFCFSTGNDGYKKISLLHPLIEKHLDAILSYSDRFDYTSDIYQLIFEKIYKYNIAKLNILIQHVITKRWVSMSNITFSKDLLIQLDIDWENDIFKLNDGDAMSFSEISFFEYSLAFYIFDHQHLLEVLDLKHYRTAQVILDDLFFKKYAAPFFNEKLIKAVFSPHGGRQDSIYTLKIWQFQRLMNITINSIGNLNILRGLRKLTWLYFEDVDFTDLDFAVEIPSLKYLSFERCNIAKFTEINSVDLKYLSLNGCNVEHGFNIENIRLEGLFIGRSIVNGFNYNFPSSLKELKLYDLVFDLNKIKHLKLLETLLIFNLILHKSVSFGILRDLKYLDLSFDQHNGNIVFFEDLPRIENIFLASKINLCLTVDIRKISSNPFKELHVKKEGKWYTFNREMLKPITKCFRWLMFDLFKKSVNYQMNSSTVIFSNNTQYFLAIDEVSSPRIA